MSDIFQQTQLQGILNLQILIFGNYFQRVNMRIRSKRVVSLILLSFYRFRRWCVLLDRGRSAPPSSYGFLAESGFAAEVLSYP